MIHQRYPRLVALGLTLALLVALLAFFARAASAQDFDVPQDVFMVVELAPGVRERLKGAVRYPSEFAEA